MGSLRIMLRERFILQGEKRVIEPLLGEEGGAEWSEEEDDDEGGLGLEVCPWSRKADEDVASSKTITITSERR